MMKRFIVPVLLAGAAFLFLPCCLSCEKKPTPEPEPAVTATLAAHDVTVEEGKTAQLDAVTNSSAPITYTSADAAVATVSPAGEVTGVKAGETTITLKVEAVENKFTSAEKTVNVTVTEAPEHPTPPDDKKPGPGMYTFTVSPFKGQWEEGDQIYVHGSFGPAARTFTLKPSDISDDGRTATLLLESGFEYLAGPDYLYAAWPASAVQPEDGLMDALTRFSAADGPLAQAYLDGTEFVFKDISSCISFTVSGGYDRVLIAGAQRPGLRFTDYANEYSTAKVTPSKISSDGYPFRECGLSPEGSTSSIWFPGGVNLKQGFVLYFARGDRWCATYTYGEDADLKAGKTLELGDISGSLADYDGPKPTMPEMGGRTRFSVKFNELSGLCVSLDSQFLWGLGDSGEIARISFAGEVLDKAGLRTTDKSTIDSEGMSVNYDTGDLLIGGEPHVVCRIPGSKIDSIFTESLFRGVESLFSIADAKGYGNAGLEGMTYYKDGKAYCGTQTGSYLYLCDLETGEVLWRKGLREMYPAVTEIAGLCYDPLTDWLWVVDSESKRFFALSGDAERMLGTYSIKGTSNPEAICVDHVNSCIWIGDDYGSTSYLYKYDFTGLDDAVITARP